MTPGTRRRRRIAVVTGTRADYGLLRSTMEAIDRHANLTLDVVAVGMHLLPKFGRTVDDIVRDGWPVAARVRMQRGDDGPLDQAEGLGRGVTGIARFLEQSQSQIVVVLGDRVEAIAGALAAVTTGRFVAHVHGGDRAPGDFDEGLRFAITKLAHLHLPATRGAARRIIRAGEDPERVHWVGAPGLDRLMQLLHGADRPKARSGRAVVLQHPCGRSATRERRVMSALLKAVTKEGLTRTIIYPNSDRGHAGIIEAIESHRRSAVNGSVQVVRSLDRDDYLRLLISSDLLVGNSSSGIIEAASAGTPVVNVGSRQKGRERSGRAVLDADESSESIRGTIRQALRRRPIIGRSTAYGDGCAGRRIARLLAAAPLTERSRRKLNTF